MILASLGLLILNLPALAALPACDAEGLTRGCKLFSERRESPVVKFPNGAFIENPLYKSNAPKAVRTADSERLKTKAALLRFWRALPEQDRPSDEFQLALGQALPHATVAEAFGGLAHEAPHHEAELLLPWPPAREGAPLMAVSSAQLREYFSNLSAERQQEVKKLVAAFEPGSSAGKAAPDARVQVAESREARVRDLFNFAQGTLLSEISRNRPYASLSEAEKSQYDRVKNLDFVSLAEAKKEPSCARMAPDAFYSWEGHRVVICPGMYTLPDASLMEVLGHEIAHPIDPCSLQIPLLKVDRKKLDELRSQEPSQVGHNPDASKLLSNLGDAGSTGMVMLSAVMSTHRKDSVPFVENLGAAKLVAPGIPFKNYPDHRAYKCLTDKVGIREVTSADLDRIARQFVRDRQGKWNATADKTLLRNVRATLGRFPQCTSPNTAKSQMGEAMSDAWSSKVLARWMEKNPPKNDMERLAPMAMFLAAYCKERPTVSTAPTTGEILDLAVDAMTRAHPYHRERAEKIFLTEPNLQKAIGCKPIQNFSCVDLLGSPRAVKDIRGVEAPTGEQNEMGAQ
jgi:hypothetical protein